MMFETVRDVLTWLPEQVHPADLPAWHIDELLKRRADAEERPGLGKPWREVIGKLDGK